MDKGRKEGGGERRKRERRGGRFSDFRLFIKSLDTERERFLSDSNRNKLIVCSEGRADRSVCWPGRAFTVICIFYLAIRADRLSAQRCSSMFKTMGSLSVGNLLNPIWVLG